MTEAGTAQEIAAFRSTTLSVASPLTEKLNVDGHNRHRLYALLTAQPDRSDGAGDGQWNFEKFLFLASC